MKPLVNSYIQKLVQTKWDVAVHGRDLYLVKPTLGPPKKFQHLTRTEGVVINRLRIGRTKVTKSHILSRGQPTACHHCGQTLTIDHMLLECAVLQECRDEYTVDSLNARFETIPETCIVEFLREAGFFYLIWCNLLTSTSPETWTIWSDMSNLFREWKQIWYIYLWWTGNMSWRTRVVVKQIQSNQPVHHDVVVYSDSMSCLLAIEGEDFENPFICHIMNLLWSLSDKGTRVRFCWVPSHCGIDGNERVDHLAKETLDQDIDPTGKCPLYRYETTGQLLHSEVSSNQVGCSCTWQRYLYCETNTGATKEVPAPNQSWRGCNLPNWPYQGHQIPYLVPRTTDWLSPLWSNTDHWPYAAGVCIVTGMSWWILHSRLVECSLRDNSWDLHSGIPAGSGILLSDMM